MISAVLLGLLFGALEFVAIWYWADRVIRHFEGESEEAKREAKVYRNLLFPVMARSEGEAVTEPIKTPKAIVPNAPNPAPSKRVQRVPFRIRFKQRVREMNSVQQGRDALISALAKQPKSEEKIHV